MKDKNWICVIIGLHLLLQKSSIVTSFLGGGAPKSPPRMNVSSSKSIETARFSYFWWSLHFALKWFTSSSKKIESPPSNFRNSFIASKINIKQPKIWWFFNQLMGEKETTQSVSQSVGLTLLTLMSYLFLPLIHRRVCSEPVSFNTKRNSSTCR